MAISQWLKSNNYRKAEGEKCCGNCVYVVVPDLYFHKGNRCSLAWDIVSPKKSMRQVYDEVRVKQ